MPLLDEWKVLPNGSVEGKVLNHPEIEDLAVIATSPLVVPVGTLALHRDGIVVETRSGSRYQLLSPSNEISLMDGRTVNLQVAYGEINTLEKLVKTIKQRGLKGAVSYAGWELGFWTVSLPLCIIAFFQLTGHWPDFTNSADLELLEAEAILRAKFERFALPLRMGLTAGTSNWGQENIVDRFSSKRDENFNE